VGEVTRVDATLLRSLVNSGYIPVVATVATDENGQALNVNADTAAGEVRMADSSAKIVPTARCNAVGRETIQLSK
jgi:acetylglutamate kinase